MKWHCYLITYSFEKDGYLTPCKGFAKLMRKKKINSFKEVDEAIDFITKQVEGAKNVIIENIMYLGKNRCDDYKEQ